MTQLTGSRLPIAQRCGWAFRSDVKYPERPRTAEAGVGTEVHAAAARIINGDQLSTFNDPMAAVLFDQFLEWWPSRKHEIMLSEVAYAYNIDTREARTLGVDIDRKYAEHGATDRDICCSVDYVGAQLVGDFKTGWASHVEPVMENLQLKFGGMCHAKVRNLNSVQVEIARIRTDGVQVESGTMTAFDLSLTESLIHEIHTSIHGAVAMMGDHCSFCPALGACPETRAGLDLVGPRTAAQWTTEFISLANDAAMAEALPALKKAMEAVESALKERYRGGAGLLLPNGKVWREVVAKREGMDTKKAAELLGDRAAECMKVSEYTQFRQVKP